MPAYLHSPEPSHSIFELMFAPLKVELSELMPGALRPDVVDEAFGMRGDSLLATGVMARYGAR